MLTTATTAALTAGCGGSHETLLSWIDTAQSHPAGPIAVVAAFVASGFVGAPLTLLMVPTLVIFGPVRGSIIILIGATLAAALFFQIGAGGAGLARRFGLPGFDGGRLAPLLERNGIVAVALARNVPIAPYPVVNLAFGTTTVRLRDFLIGNAIGLTPWIALYAFAGEQLRELAASPSPARIALVALCFAAIIALSALVARLLKRFAAGPAVERESE
jgi:uncharacterized membrane protein YdjX (TVP38/TMEM64 family)